jgi:hypothetical protein
MQASKIPCSTTNGKIEEAFAITNGKVNPQIP